MQRRVLSIYNLEELNDAAEYIISTAQFNFADFDDDGNYIAFDMYAEERSVWRDRWFEESRNHYLCFRHNEELHRISFADAVEMSLAEIKENYLKKHLRKLRNILRKDPAYLNGFVVSNDVPDSYLDDLLALRWKENLKLWAMQWDKKRNKPEGSADEERNEI